MLFPIPKNVVCKTEKKGEEILSLAKTEWRSGSFKITSYKLLKNNNGE